MHNMEIVVREYEKKDLKTILQITLLAWKPIYASFKKLMGRNNYAAFYPNWKTYKIAQMKDFLKSKNLGTVVAEENGLVVGLQYTKLTLRKKLLKFTTTQCTLNTKGAVSAKCSTKQYLKP